MASSDIDQKYLAHIASMTSATHPLLAAPFYSLLGLSSMLSARVHKAKKMRRLDLSRDTPSLIHYQHIIWLVREGLEILEADVLPHTMNGKLGAEATVLAARLRASFYHLLSLFHNEPPASQVPPPRSSSRNDTATGVLGVSHRHNNSKSSIVSEKFSPKANQSKSKNGTTGRTPTLRDPVASATSDASFITNPYASNRPSSAVSSPAPPPGLGGPTIAPRPSAFLFPPMNFLPITESHFVNADRAATALLPGSHPLRLSTAVEHCAFIWDCLHDFQYARRLARQTIRAVYHAKEGMDDEDFEEAAKMVDQLGKIMKRRSWDGAIRPAGEGIPEQIQEETPQSQISPLAHAVPIREGGMAQFTPPPPMEQVSLTTQERGIIRRSEGDKHVEGYLRKHKVFQLFRCLKKWLPIRTQVRKKCILPRGPVRVEDQQDVPVRRIQVDDQLNVTDRSRETRSFQDHMGHMVPEPPTPFLAPKYYSSTAVLRRLRRCPAPIDTGLANRRVNYLPRVQRSSPSPCGPCPLDLDKSLPPTPCSSSPTCASSCPLRPRPAPIDTDKANGAAWSHVVDEYVWSPRVHRKKTDMIRNIGGLSRFRNEAFPPIEGATQNCWPEWRLLPTSIQFITGQVITTPMWRYVQPCDVFDREKYEAAVQERDEDLLVGTFQKSKRDYEHMAVEGKLLYEKLKVKWECKMAQIEAQSRAQQQQHT
ncbi:hypothetical protein HDK77DRAFT_190631 [Phyllosticta capitalensis]